MDKWHHMSTIVKQRHAQNPITLSPNLSRQFKKLVISRLITENCLAMLLQYLGLMLMGIITPQAIAPLWFASGTATAFIFMRGFTILPGIFLGNFLAYFSQATFFIAGIHASLDTVQAFLLLWLSYRYLTPTLVFYNIEKFIQFIIFCGMLTAATSFILVLVYYPLIHQHDMIFQSWLQWWLGNLNGILVFGCAMATWDVYFPQIDNLKKSNKWMLAFYYGLLFVIILTLLVSHTSSFRPWLCLVTVPVIIAISLRLGWSGTIAAVFLFGLSLNLAAYLNAPLFTHSFSQMTLVFIQAILLIETGVGGMVALYTRNTYIFDYI